MKKVRVDGGEAVFFEAMAEEILFLILDCLDSSSGDKKAFSLVCRSWRDVESRHRKVLKPFPTDLLSAVLGRYSAVPRLDLSLCPLVSDDFLAATAITAGAALRSIDLSRSRSFTQAGLETLVARCPSLAEIDLSNATELGDSAAATIARARNLEKLSLARCKRVTDIGLVCIAVGCPKLKALSLRWCLGVTDLSIGIVAVKCREIRSLDLSYVQVTGKCLPQIFQLRNLQFLSLEGCLGIEDASLAAIQKECRSLVTLNLSNSPHLAHLGLPSFTRGAVRLRDLSLSHCGSVSHSLANNLQKISVLQSLHLDGVRFSSSGLKAVADSCSSLRELSLCKSLGVTDEGLSLIVGKNKGLEKLDITCCRMITSLSIENITRSCPLLRCLKMESCTLVSKEAYLWVGERCRLLEELDLTDNELDSEGLKAISGCQRLVALRIGLCLKIDDEGLGHVGMHCHRLRELDLYRSVGITDNGIGEIAKGCRGLEMVNMSYCEQITDNSLLFLSQCPKMKIIEIRGCPEISSRGLSSIALGCKQLVKLDVKKCVKIDDSGMIPLASSSQNLRQINLSHCSVTDVGLLALAGLSCLQSMIIVHVRGLTVSGLATALLACGGLARVKLHVSFKSLLPKNLIDHLEARGCLIQWRDKPFQAVDSKPIRFWKLPAGPET
ncbi:RNI-like superfamily protein [Wolffia australiana]